MTVNRWNRPLATFVLTLVLTSGLASKPARAQEPEPAPAEGEGSGRPWDGYIATSMLAGLAIFIVCKSARRS